MIKINRLFFWFRVFLAFISLALITKEHMSSIKLIFIVLTVLFLFIDDYFFFNLANKINIRPIYPWMSILICSFLFFQIIFL